MTKSIRVMTLPVEGAAEFTELPAETLSADLNRLVGGYFQCIPLVDGIHLWVNEDGKGIGLAPNANAQALWDAVYGFGTDYVVGEAVLTGGADRHGNTLGLSDANVLTLRSFYQTR
jgi:hypothetical protein